MTDAAASSRLSAATSRLSAARRAAHVRRRRVVVAAHGRWRRFEDRLPGPVRRFERWLRGPEFMMTSSSLAYYALVSIPPMALIAFWLAGAVLPQSALDALVRQIEHQSPDQLSAGPMARGLFEVARRAGPVSVIAAAWPATAYGAALGRAFSAVAPGEVQRIGGWKGRLLALAILAVLPLVIVSAVAALFLGPRILGTGLPFTLGLGSGALVLVWLLIVVIFSLYRLRDVSPSDVLLAAAGTAGLEALIGGGFLLWLRLGTTSSERYGTHTLTAAVLFALWLLLGNAAMVSGYRVMLRRVEHRHRRPPADDGPADDDPASGEGASTSEAAPSRGRAVDEVSAADR